MFTAYEMPVGGSNFAPVEVIAQAQSAKLCNKITHNKLYKDSRTLEYFLPANSHLIEFYPPNQRKGNWKKLSESHTGF